MNSTLPLQTCCSIHYKAGRLVPCNYKTKRKEKLATPIERLSGYTVKSKHSTIYTLYVTTTPAREAQKKKDSRGMEQWPY
jgi:hypothetical protein